MLCQERRNAQRFQIKLPMTVRWTNGAAIGEARTESRDVCSGGIWFFLPNEIKNDSLVEVDITLPHEITLAGPVMVRCLGHVTRSQKETDGMGIAVHIESYEFLGHDAEPA